MSYRYERALDKCIVKIRGQHPDWDDQAVEEAGLDWLRGIIVKDGCRPTEVFAQMKRNVKPRVGVMVAPKSESEQALIKENERLTRLCDRLEADVNKYIDRYGRL